MLTTDTTTYTTTDTTTDTTTADAQQHSPRLLMSRVAPDLAAMSLEDPNVSYSLSQVMADLGHSTPAAAIPSALMLLSKIDMASRSVAFTAAHTHAVSALSVFPR